MQLATKGNFEPLSPDAALRSNWRNARKADMAAQANGPDLPFDRTYCAALQTAIGALRSILKAGTIAEWDEADHAVTVSRKDQASNIA